MKIKALREFSHYTLGTVDQGQVKEVSDKEAVALCGMELAVVVEEAQPVADEATPKQKPKPRK